jgi:hypothetical protein
MKGHAMAGRLEQWQLDMLAVVDDKLMRQISEDFRRGPPSPGPTLPSVTPVGAGRVVDADVGPKYRGWTEATPLRPMPLADPRSRWLSEDEVKELKRKELAELEARLGRKEGQEKEGA